MLLARKTGRRGVRESMRGGGMSRSECGALEKLFEKHGLGDIYQRATQELGLEVLNLLALLVQKYKY